MIQRRGQCVRIHFPVRTQPNWNLRGRILFVDLGKLKNLMNYNVILWKQQTKDRLFTCKLHLHKLNYCIANFKLKNNIYKIFKNKKLWKNMVVKIISLLYRKLSSLAKLKPMWNMLLMV